jgi:hypothetical protein
MTLTTMDKKYIKFNDLCKKQHNMFSLEQAAKEANTNMKSLRQWCLLKDDSENKEDQKNSIKFRKRLISMCPFYCAKNVARAFGKGELTQKQAEKYLIKLQYLPSSLPYFQEAAKKSDEIDARMPSLKHMDSLEYIENSF